MSSVAWPAEGGGRREVGGGGKREEGGEGFGVLEGGCVQWVWTLYVFVCACVRAVVCACV